MRLVLALLLLAATGVQEGADYHDEDLDAKAPGPRWRLQTAIPEAPALRGAYVFPRTDGAKDRSSLITFVLDEEPGKPLQPYVEDGLKELQVAPLSFRITKSGPFKSKDKTAYRAEYTDKDGVRHFLQVATETPAGGVLVAVLQAPDAEAYGEDVPIFLAFVEKMAPAKPKPVATPAVTGKKKGK